MTQGCLGHFRVSERGKRSNYWTGLSEVAPAHSVFWEGKMIQYNSTTLIITYTKSLKHGFSVDSLRTIHVRYGTKHRNGTPAVHLPLWFTHTHAYTVWMWNITHKTGSMSVSYEPAMKPLVDKSPPTGVEEFGSLMKKSCWAGRSWSAWLWGF